MAIYERIDSVVNDNLIGGPEVETLLQNVTVTPGTAIKRGTLITVDKAGAAKATATGEVANAVLAYTIDDKAATATVYVAGRFNREALIAADGDTVKAHELELRGVNIYVTSIH